MSSVHPEARIGAHVTVDEAQAVQAAGDVLGEARSLLLEIAPQSLIVRVGGPS